MPKNYKLTKKIMPKPRLSKCVSPIMLIQIIPKYVAKENASDLCSYFCSFYDGS